ncbi:Wzz/FepE/Etk N-terminal domain-containing protein [Rheinheimera nanhaiensis]|uniref:Lipopolysaccharide biosynthesis protein n=1 Tax=Rheinheimera nanhaiensis E407-8 TaxID=562729 RepID=I1DWC4_9GAMM|nr:Wzz/FepE/Etk N-terminal domain-containing protein [Rheinheimera nanhaiensis]GAB58352.1 lipopolysaccharide biosynthesis protein [Rheinheimera nanhaiensis E407-8]
MSEQQNATLSRVADDEIDLRELFAAIWQGKWLIIAVTAIFAVASVFYALSLPNIYKSEALLAPAAEQKGAGLSGQLGGLAALAGVSLGSGAGVDKTALAIEVVKSRDFLSRFIQQRIQLQDLMAVKSWDLTTNSLKYDLDVYNPESQQWLREVKPPKQAQPSLQEAYKALSEILSVSQDKTTGMVKLSIEHQSPYIAQSWVQMLIADLNLEMKTRDIEEAEKSIAYLQQQISQTNIADLRTALYSLIEEQTKTLMLANVRDEYALKVIDSAIVPEEKARPARAVLVIVCTFLGGFIAIFAVILRHYFRQSRASV